MLVREKPSRAWLRGYREEGEGGGEWPPGG